VGDCSSWNRRRDGGGTTESPWYGGEKVVGQREGRYSRRVEAVVKGDLYLEGASYRQEVRRGADDPGRPEKGGFVVKKVGPR